MTYPRPLIPLRMLNEYVYCHRLASLEWAQGEFAHSADTVWMGKPQIGELEKGCFPVLYRPGLMEDDFRFFKQHFLYFFPLPHGHGSFRPTLGTSNGCLVA